MDNTVNLSVKKEWHVCFYFHVTHYNVLVSFVAKQSLLLYNCCIAYIIVLLLTIGVQH